MPSGVTAFAFETLTVSNSVKTLTASKYAAKSSGGLYQQASEAAISVDGTAGTNDLRWTLEGTNPVATTTGHKLKAGETLTVSGYDNIKALKMIRDGSSDAVIQVTYFRPA